MPDAHSSSQADTASPDPVEALTVDALHTALNDAGYICSCQRARSVLAALMTDPLGGFFAFGPPGTGKTWLLEVLGEILDMDTFFKQVSPGSREEDLILDLLPDEEAPSGIKKQWGELPKAVQASHKGNTLLILDEWDKTRPTADAFLLDFLQNGRVNYGDIQVQADMDNLYVGITLNDERDLSGPAHRRMPYLHFDPLHPSLVREALRRSHGDHPYREAAVNLYVRCERSMMEKSCTIQELQQLLDAITVLGPDDADWNQLVLDYVTKDRDNHRLLKKAEDIDPTDWSDTRWEDQDADPLDPSAYGRVEETTGGPELDPADETALPPMADVKGYTGPTNDETPDLAAAFAALERSESVYDALTRRELPAEAPDRFGRVRVQGDTITFDTPVPLLEHDGYAAGLWGHAGEVVFAEDTASRTDLRLLQAERDLEFISYAEDELIARYEGIHLRWTPDDGAHIIVPTARRDTFDALFAGTWLNAETVPSPVDPLPTPVLARLGASEVGTIEARHAGEPVATPYFSGVFDFWTGNEHDTVDVDDIPGYDDFMRHAETHADTIIAEGTSVYVLFENLMMGVLGEDNDYLTVAVTGAFDPALNSYLQHWLPNAKLSLSRRGPARHDGTMLAREEGFEVTRPSDDRPNPSKTLVRTRNNVRCIYRDGRLTVGSQLRGRQITAAHTERLIEEIDRQFQALTE
ncbi:MAG: ATP-binding protein [Bacteroidetes bacterium SW_9_63_38]|nr:MAG: ATP-binding protein [Bacteroidetes bacterium SW_9_63_38]